VVKTITRLRLSSEPRKYGRGLFHSVRCAHSNGFRIFSSPLSFVAHLLAKQSAFANNLSLHLVPASILGFSERHQFQFGLILDVPIVCACHEKKWLTWYQAQGISVLQLQLVGKQTILFAGGYMIEVWNALLACDKTVLINMTALPAGPPTTRESELLSCVPLHDISVNQANMTRSVIRSCAKPDKMVNIKWNETLCLCAPAISLTDVLPYIGKHTDACWLPSKSNFLQDLTVNSSTG